MATNLSNPAASMSPGQHQELANARTQPIGTASDAATSLHQLDTAHGRLLAGMRGANRTYVDMTTLPETIGDEVRQAVERHLVAVCLQVHAGCAEPDVSPCC